MSLPDLARARSALVALAADVPPAEGRVVLDTTGPVARLVIDNPGARNALTVAMLVQLADAVIALERWSGAALVLSSTGDTVFSAGGHIGQLTAAAGVEGGPRTMARAMATVLDGLLDLPVVSVAALQGPAIGGGAELITSCDHRVFGPRAAVRFVHSRLGVAPGWGGAARLVELVGRRVALRLLSTGTEVDAAGARTLGLADALADDALEGARVWLDPVAAAVPSSIRACKAQIVAAGRGRRLDDREAEAFASVWGGPAHLAALERLRKRR